MYESSCSYQSALDLKRVTSCTSIKSEECGSGSGDWAGCAYRFACNSSTFEQLKQSVEKAKAALQDRGGYSAFSDLAAAPFCPPPGLPEPDKRSHSEYSTLSCSYFKFEEGQGVHLRIKCIKGKLLQERGGCIAFSNLAATPFLPSPPPWQPRA